MTKKGERAMKAWEISKLEDAAKKIAARLVGEGRKAFDDSPLGITAEEENAILGRPLSAEESNGLQTAIRRAIDLDPSS